MNHIIPSSINIEPSKIYTKDDKHIALFNKDKGLDLIKGKNYNRVFRIDNVSKTRYYTNLFDEMYIEVGKRDYPHIQREPLTTNP